MATPVSELDLPDLTHLDLPGISHEEARAAMSEIAEEHWLAKNFLGVTALRYEDVVAMLRDKRWHSASGKILEYQGIDDPEWLARRRTSILSAEGDEHTRLRRLVGPAFSPKHADALRPFMREVVNGLIDNFVDRGEVDLAVEFCEPYPIPIICELFGAPKEDWKLFSAWATDIFRIFNGNLVEDKHLIIQAQDELDAYIGDLIEQRRSIAERRPDLRAHRRRRGGRPPLTRRAGDALRGGAHGRHRHHP